MPEDFETQLRQALRRREPSPGFAERVIAGANAPKHSSRRAWAAIAAMVVAAPMIYEYHQQRRAEEAHEQALTALRITAEKLNSVREKMMNRQMKVTEGEIQKP